MFPSQLLNKYEVDKRPIGKGGYGLIFKGINKKNNEKVAIKVLYYVENFNISEFDELVNNEINMMKLFKNEHSIKLYEYIKDKNDYYLILEYCDTDLEKYVSEKKGLKIYEIEKILKQLNEIYKELLQLNCIHRDLKPSNILIKFKNKDKSDFDIKLSDYGLSKNMNSKKYFSSKVGTFYFMAPEIFFNDGDNKFKNSCDLWSIGIIIYFLYYNEIPFDEKEIFQKKFVLTKFTDYKILEYLLKNLLVVDVEKRIKWEDYFKISFFNECYLTEMIELINNIEIKNKLKMMPNLNKYTFMKIINENLKINNEDKNSNEIKKLNNIINNLQRNILDNNELINNLLKEIENKNKEIHKFQNENKILLEKYTKIKNNLELFKEKNLNNKTNLNIQNINNENDKNTILKKNTFDDNIKTFKKQTSDINVEDDTNFQIDNFSAEIIQEINKIRKNPKQFINFLEEEKNYFEGNTLKLPNKSIITKEGVNAYDEAINFLKNLEPIPEIKIDSSLFQIANDYLKEAKEISYEEIDFLDVDLDKYIKKYGSFRGKFCKLADYGGNSAKRIITNFITCDGDKNRSYRLNLLSNDYKFIGIASTSSYPVYNYFTVLLICTKFCKLNPNIEKPILLEQDIKKTNTVSIMKKFPVTIRNDPQVKDKIYTIKGKNYKFIKKIRKLNDGTIETELIKEEI